MEERILQRRAAFVSDVGRLPPLTVVRKHITLGPCCALEGDLYFALKEEIGQHFDIHPSEVMVVGSGKLGFSIAPKKRYRNFGETSDIDVAIVSRSLFDSIWDSVRRFRYGGGYWEEEADFCWYLLDGWIRPDKLPNVRGFHLTRDWWDFFQAVTSRGQYGPYKIRGALYRTWDHIESYQLICVTDCKREAEQRK